MEESKVVGIYKITNIKNNKVYIGQSVNIKTRWKQHIAELNSNKHGNEHLQYSWNKYGENSFVFETICECEKESLDDLEIKYIEEYDSMNNIYGYNIREGGNGGLSQETILKLRGLGSTLSYEDVKRIKMCMFLLMDRNEIAKQFNVSSKVLTAISQGKNFEYILPDINDKIHNLKQTLIDERNQHIVSKYKKGIKISEICKEMDLSTSIVEKAVYRYCNPNDRTEQIEKYNKIFELHNSGINNYQISKIVGVSPSTVKRYLVEGVHPLNRASNKKINDELENKVINLYFTDNIGSVEIGKRLDISKTTVMNIVNKYIVNKSTAS